MLNPYAYLRKMSGLTQKQFCDEYKFAKQTLILIEQGVSPELSPRMVAAILDACRRKGVDAADVLSADYGTPQLKTAYVSWRKFERAKVTLPQIPPAIPTPENSPMFYLVRDTIGTVQGFAKKLKIPPATLVRYMRGLQAEMPASVRDALIDVGYIYITELITAQAQWAIDYVLSLNLKDDNARSIRN